MTKYYTKSGEYIRNPEAYAKTGAPMFTTRYEETEDINKPTDIYKLNLENGKKYIGKTANIDQRMMQHFNGKGTNVTKKFSPLNGKIVDTVPGYFSNEYEQEYDSHSYYGGRPKYRH